MKALIILGNDYKSCRNISIRKGAIFENNSRTPISVLYIIKYWIIDSFNAQKIKTKLEEQNKLEKVDILFLFYK
jgi:hypothetical protein